MLTDTSFTASAYLDGWLGAASSLLLEEASSESEPFAHFFFTNKIMTTMRMMRKATTAQMIPMRRGRFLFFEAADADGSGTGSRTKSD